MAPFAPSTVHDNASTFCFHSFTKAMHTASMNIMGLKRSFHGKNPFILCFERLRFARSEQEITCVAQNHTTTISTSLSRIRFSVKKNNTTSLFLWIFVYAIFCFVKGFGCVRDILSLDLELLEGYLCFFFFSVIFVKLSQNCFNNYFSQLGFFSFLILPKSVLISN